jgi:hypothetical protein
VGTNSDLAGSGPAFLHQHISLILQQHGVWGNEGI